ncbi:MAG: endopeptidase La [Erysipelotrichaceae bacterium]|nr:endopeptidase La [Erysipelotrichaceae bacterium]
MNQQTLPLLCTRGALIFPEQELTVEVGRSSSIRSVERALRDDSEIFVTSQIDQSVEDPGIGDVYRCGTVCSIKSYRRKDDHLRVIFRGLERARCLEEKISEDVRMVSIERLKDYVVDSAALDILFKKAFAEFNDFIQQYAREGNPVRLLEQFRAGLSAAALTDSYAQLYVGDLSERARYMAELNIEKRLEMMLESLNRSREIQKIEEEINNKVKTSIEENQKDYYLREKLRAIKEELDDAPGSDIDDLKELVEKNPYPEAVKNKAREEFRHYEMLPPSSGEAGVIRSYLETLLYVPWYQRSEDNDDLQLAEQILDEDHYGLKKVKERILEYLAVKQMTNSLKSPIICLVGPPGVGKTSLARSVARALDRRFVKISLGGVRDEAEIRGHRRTYLGSMPGRIIQGMKRAGTLNPVFLIDEIDKMSSDYKGDPSSAMLEVLDPEQNYAFSDHYLEEPYDLSDVLFIATANYMESIPNELKDRLEIIELSSYTEIEKLHIAREHLIGKQLKANGLKPSQFHITDEQLLYLIRHYTREAGVRQLERVIGSLCRKSVLAVLKEGKKSVRISRKQIQSWLGHEIYEYGTKEKKDQVGVVTGLAYTSFGGDILPIEVNYFKGSGKLVVTGQLGDVMKESTTIALDYIKANAERYGIDMAFFNENDIHIHVPEGAVPKDGPSAGITLTTALVSAITGRPARADLAMTGEVTLRGNVLNIGGLREKSLAAHRSGIKTILLPKGNLKDLDDIPDSVKNEIEFIPIEQVDQAIKAALR